MHKFSAQVFTSKETKQQQWKLTTAVILRYTQFKPGLFAKKRSSDWSKETVYEKIKGP